jgi:hypothetical protein
MERGLFRSALGLAVVALALTLAIAVLLMWRTSGGQTPRGSVAIPSLPPGDSTVLVGAGDIAECGDDADERTADLVAAIPGTVFVAGDNKFGQRHLPLTRYRSAAAARRGREQRDEGRWSSTPAR